MIQRNTYGPAQVYKSILRFCGDLCETSPVLLRYHAWDSRGEENELPRQDLMGLSGWTYREDDGLIYISCGFTLSTIEDANLMREIDILDHVHANAGKGRTVPIRDMTTSEQINEMVISSFEIMPTGQSNLRNYRTAAVEMLLTRPA